MQSRVWQSTSNEKIWSLVSVITIKDCK